VYHSLPDSSIASARELERRAAVAFASFLAGLDRWDAFYTLTYDPDRSMFSDRSDWQDPAPPTPDAVRRHTQRWLKALPDVLGCPYVAVAATELHKSGWPHVHVILASGGLPSRPLIAAAQAWYEKHGYAKYKPIGGVQEVSLYVSKYMTKANTEVFFWPSAGALAHQRSLRR
jgi:hypothetical protein